jgi:hypothetical protein
MNENIKEQSKIEMTSSFQKTDIKDLSSSSFPASMKVCYVSIFHRILREAKEISDSITI